jgi:hypothetical protein
MKLEGAEAERDTVPPTAQLEQAIGEVVRTIKSVSYGSVEVVIHNSRIVQIERKEKLRFDRS